MRGARFAGYVVAVAGATALIPGALAARPAAGGGLPAHLYAPYFETWTSGGVTTIAQESGARYFTLAFLQTLSKTSCTLAWNGDRSRTLASGDYLADVASLRAIGGDVIPSLGGWSADQGGTEIGDSCKDPGAIAAAYESVVTTYEVKRLDMDIEGRSLTKPDGIDRRNKAIKLLQDWATAQGRTVQIQYTLPTDRSGFPSSSLAVLQNAVANGVRVDVVNPMVFDYWDRQELDMGDSAISALNGIHSQLAALYPSKTSAEIWATQGATIMNGLDDFPRRTELTELQDAQQILDFARANAMSLLSMWAIQRDNGGCPGSTGSNNCSGIVQNAWDFTYILKAFTG